ncbi:hypothetical protein QFC22_001508 [Naganishia vaughanmartiniae]|uniref:Uncharacterized protein n=1 Tax=Naganishia vaughanmartiniae TaxID=1424756 RepID=A0ACC2XH16_9TREE|nr:hypothetical protein QFC22_001508 [Naganishia vaughanmartiniae]
MNNSNEMSDYLDFGIYDSDPIPDPISPATLAMSPFSSIATIASNTFGDASDFPISGSGFPDDPLGEMLDFPMCSSAAANDGTTSFSPFALTAPFPEFTDAQDHGAQSTLMQSHHEPQQQQSVASADVDIAALLRQYNQGSAIDSIKQLPVAAAVLEPMMVAVKQEPMDDVLMSVNHSAVARPSGISPAALFGSSNPQTAQSSSTTTNATQDFSALHPSALTRSASYASASEDEDEAHEAVTPDHFTGARDHHVDVVTAASIDGSRKSSVAAAAITGKRLREVDANVGSERSNVKPKIDKSPSPMDFSFVPREATPVRELSATHMDDTDGGFDASASNARINIDSLKPLPLPSMFGGIKGKGGKKGGGLSSVVLEDPAEAGEDDDWRPTPEEYKKLSSKEKRQLRNKLSARAFRTRRKTYINELEDHIKDRDRLIDAIKGELMTSRSENDELKREIDALKKAAMAPVPSSLKEMTPAPTSALVAGLGLTTAHNQPGRQSSTSSINTYNPRKDVSGSTSAALSAMSPKFWGATSGGLGGGFTTCHTTFVPDLVLPLGSPPALASPSSSSAYTSAYSSPGSSSSSATPYMFARANLNPLLNDPSMVAPQQKSSDPTSPTTSSISLLASNDGSDLSDSFGNWSAQNGFTWNNLDAYRMQLWSRMARDASYARQGVPVEMRPKFLREQHSKSSSTSVTGALSPVGTSPYAPAPPTYKESHDDPVPSITQIVQHTISTRLFSSFLNALKAPTTTAAGTGRLDTDKIADIVSGKAHLGVLPSEPPAYSEKHRTSMPSVADTFDADAEQALAMSFTNLKLATESIARSKSAAAGVVAGGGSR